MIESRVCHVDDFVLNELAVGEPLEEGSSMVSAYFRQDLFQCLYGVREALDGR